MTIGFPFGASAQSHRSIRVLAISKSGGQDFDGKSPRHLFMNVGSLAGPKSRSNGRFWRKAVVDLLTGTSPTHEAKISIKTLRASGARGWEMFSKPPIYA
jgi:hypothetical protein